MVLLPVVERELRVASRGRAMYRVRFWAALAMSGILAWSLLDVAKLQNMSAQGEEVIGYLTLCAFVFSALIGVVATSDAVSREKREGTLGLLFLTDLKGYDVICGKMAANSLNALYALVATLPVMGIPLLMGGITFAQFAKIALVLITTMVLSLSVGIFVSTFSRNERKSMVFTFLILCAMTCLPVFLVAWYSDHYSIAQADVWMGLMFSPGYGIVQTVARGTGWLPASYWFSVAWQWLIAALLLARACAHVPKSWEEGTAKKSPRFRASKDEARSSSRTADGRAWLENNPILWLALQGEEASRGRVWLFVASMLTIWIIVVLKFGMEMAADENLMWFEMFIINTPLKIWIAAEASRLFSESRSSNAFELMLATPLREAEIIGGQWRALREQFLKPLAVVFAWEIIVMFYNLHHHRWGWGGEPSAWPQILLMAADSVTLALAGMWFGLRFKGRIRALLASLTLVLFLPTGTALLCIVATQKEETWTMFTMLRVFGVDPIVAGWAWSSLVLNFRKMAVQRS